MRVSRDKLEAFAAACRQAAQHALVRCSSGNMSARLDEHHMLIKASRAWMADMTPDDVALCRIADGATLNGRTPTVEIGFHAGVLRTRPDVNVVLHFQSSAATALACSTDLPSINFFVIPEMAYYIGPVAVVPYLLPGSAMLADAVVAAMKDHDMAILRNHGQVTAGKDYADAIQKAAFFELACHIILHTAQRASALSPSAIAQLRSAGRGA